MSIPNPCCCPCSIYRDEFATDSITGGGWAEESGEWSIAGGLLSTEDSDGLIVAQALHPDGDSAYQVVRVKVRFDTAGDRARLAVAIQDDDNYLFTEYWIGADGCGHVQMYSRVSGTDTPVGDEFALPFQVEEGGWSILSLCLSDQLTTRVVYRGFASFGGRIWAQSVTASGSGDQGGVGTGTVTGTVDFDDFDYLYHYDAEEHPDCPECKENVDCLLQEDNFNRDDNTEVGCGWEEVAGDWEIEDDELTVAAPNAIIRSRTRLLNADGEFDGHVSVEFTMRCAAGVIPRAYFDLEDDANYFAVQFEPGSHGDSGRITFWRNTAGTEEQIPHDSVVPGMMADESLIQVHICWRPDGVVRAFVNPITGYLGDVPTLGPGGSFTTVGITPAAAEPSFALGTGDSGSAQVWFDDFVMYRYGEDLEDYDHFGDCHSCGLQECELYVGEFHDEDNDLWTTIAGAWAATADVDVVGELSANNTGTDDSDALLICETGHPQTTNEGYLDLTSAVQVYIYSEGFGSVVRAIIGWQDDDNYLFGEIEFSADDESTGFVRACKMEDGTPTVLDETETSILDGQPVNEPIGGARLLKVCYDGYELRVLALGVYAAGNAGTGWNPGKAGVGTGTISSPVYFGGFTFSHDIFGEHVRHHPEGFDYFVCQSCAPELTCDLCGICEDDELADRTPPIMLLRVTGIAWNEDEHPYCLDLESFNDTFALPLASTSSSPIAHCQWEARLGFCIPDPEEADEEIEYPRAFVAITKMRTSPHEDPVSIPIDVVKVQAGIRGYHPTLTDTDPNWDAEAWWIKRFASEIGRDSIDNDAAWLGFYHPELQNIHELAESLILREPCDDPPAADDEIPAINCLSIFADWHTIAEADPDPAPLMHTVMIDFGGGPEPYEFEAAPWPSYYYVQASDWLVKAFYISKAEVKVLAP